MRRAFLSIAIAMGLGLLGSACGSSDDAATAEVPERAPETSSPQPTATPEAPTVAPTAEPTATAQPEQTATPTSQAAPEPATTLPQSADPCTDPADHATGATTTEHTFQLDGQARPMGVIVGDQALDGDATVWVLLHGAGLGWQTVLPLATTEFADGIGPADSRVVVAAQAGPGSSAFWTQSETFNVEYLTTLFDHLGAAFCLERADVILAATGQGTLAAAQAICNADLPVDALYLLLGMVKMAACEPPRAVPILSIDMYEFDSVFGNHWDGSWNPPPAIEIELTGGIDATPDDAAVWAEVYRCAAPPTMETLPDEDDALERDSTLLAYRDCDAPIVAFGFENAPSGVSTDAGDAASDLIMAELAGFLDR